MKCIECGGNMTKSSTTEVLDTNNCLIIIRNVPCFKCDECGEISYDGATVKKLEQLTNLSKSIANEITVIDYSKAAA